MIYRIVAEKVDRIRREGEAEEWGWEGTGNDLRGIFRAGFSEGFSDLPCVWVEHPRARFYFTEAGWRVYGRRVAAAATKHGIIIRVRCVKNPDQSRVVYQDRYQIVVLPSRSKSK